MKHMRTRLWWAIHNFAIVHGACIASSHTCRSNVMRCEVQAARPGNRGTNARQKWVTFPKGYLRSTHPNICTGLQTLLRHAASHARFRQVCVDMQGVVILPELHLAPPLVSNPWCCQREGKHFFRTTLLALNVSCHALQVLSSEQTCASLLTLSYMQSDMPGS